MRVLMISLDRNLLGDKKAFGDAMERHKIYGKYVENLDIIVLNKGQKDKIKINENVTVYPTNSFSRFFYFFDILKISQRIFKKSKFDLIVCQDPFVIGLAGYLIKKKNGAKLIVHSHGDFFGNKFWLQESFLNRFFLLLGAFVIKRADAVRAVSQKVKEKIIKMGVSEDKIFQISTPIDFEKFFHPNKKEIKKIQEKYQNKEIVLFVGRLVLAKNISLLINAFQEVLKNYSEAVLLIIGSGELKNELKEEVEKKGLKKNIYFLGAKQQNELINFYWASNFLVLASSNESFGKVFLEAGACRKPVIASATAGAKEIIKDGKTGFIVPINNKEALADKILFLLKNKEKQEEMGRVFQKEIKENFSQEKNVQKIIEMWKEVLGEKE